MTLRDRIKYLAKDQGFSINSFEEWVGLSNGTLGKKGDIQVKTLDKIIAAFPTLNLDWLLKGKGDMFDRMPNEVNESDFESYQIDFDNIPENTRSLARYTVQSFKLNNYTNKEIREDIKCLHKEIDNLNNTLQELMRRIPPVEPTDNL